MLSTDDWRYHGNFSVKYCPDLQKKIYAVKETSGFEEIAKIFNISDKDLDKYKLTVDLKDRNIIFVYVSTGDSSKRLGVKNVKLMDSVFNINAVFIRFYRRGGFLDMHGNMFAFSVPKRIDENNVTISYEDMAVNYSEETSRVAYNALLAPDELNS